MKHAKSTAMTIYGESAGVSDSKVADAIAKHASISQSLRMLNAMIELAKTEPGIPISQSRLDHNPMLLGVANGIIDLSSGELRTPVRDDYITRQAHVSYDSTANCPQWERFLKTIMGGDDDLVQFLQRAIGYSLTGHTTEQCLFFLYGIGKNGKSTFLGVLKSLLADYAARCESETLMVKSRDGGANNDIARLRGARFVSTIEAEEGKRFGESLVKQLTGGDPIVARFLFQEHFEYMPEFKIWLAANHKPIIRGDDYAIWRRIRLIPFTVTIPENDVDKALLEKLAAERSGILNWAIEGCLAWQRDGLQPPKAVREATENYKTEMDLFGRWLEDCCTCRPGTLEFEDGAKALYDSYRQWCDEAGSHPLGSVKFYLKLEERGFTKQRTAQGMIYHGVAVGAKM